MARKATMGAEEAVLGGTLPPLTFQAAVVHFNGFTPSRMDDVREWCNDPARTESDFQRALKAIISDWVKTHKKGLPTDFRLTTPMPLLLQSPSKFDLWANGREAYVWHPVFFDRTLPTSFSFICPGSEVDPNCKGKLKPNGFNAVDKPFRVITRLHGTRCCSRCDMKCDTCERKVLAANR